MSLLLSLCLLGAQTATAPDATASRTDAPVFRSSNVDLLGHVDLEVFGARSGNDCWGYVSPSGREYAMISLYDRVCFVEITNPREPEFFATIPHRGSFWGDIKTYKHAAYIVCEAAGSGVQVVDLREIDDHKVTLVKTIEQPGSSHNVAVDTDSGFLYTCGSKQGPGTTMCFDLSDPLDPKLVGKDSITATYQHDVQVVTFFDGPYEGRQILYGSSERRGLEIHDVTDKDNPILLSTTDYEGVGYTHQGWLNEDRTIFYVNDELDELGKSMAHRTMVFDVSDIENPKLLGEFSCGLETIDHNLYVHEGLIYQANYTSGLRIFDSNVDPVNPPEVGWFDTHPEKVSLVFAGAWSTYPFFPSGNVIVSDINRGLFIFDVSKAKEHGRALKEESLTQNWDRLTAVR